MSAHIEMNTLDQKVGDPLIVPAGNYEDPADRFILVTTKDLEKEEIDLLKEYGRVILFDSKVYMNISIQRLTFDYFVLDIRKSDDRHYLMQIDKQYMDMYNVISFCHFFQKEDAFHEEVGVDNILTKLPIKQAFKNDFDRLLLQKRITKPQAALSCFKSVLRLFQGDIRR